MGNASLSSLGAGSGVLTFDVIDKLKQADEASMIKPFENRLSNVQNKETALTDLTTQLSLFKTSIIDFRDGNIFQKRITDINGSSVSASVNSGVSIQKVKIDVQELAQNDIYQSKGYSKEDSIINNSGSSQTLKLIYNGESVDINLDDKATLTDLKDAINDANIGVNASIIDTGNDDNPYRLILKGNETGADNIIKFDYGAIDDLSFNQEIYQSKEYSADTDKVNDSGDTQTFKISVNGTDFSMDLDDGATVQDMVDKINNGDMKDDNGNSLSGLSAKYEDGHIKLHTQDIGDISITDDNLTTAINDNTDTTNTNRLQTAQNSKFTYNGVEVQRDSNEIKDLIIGVTFNLNTSGETTLNIKQDKDSINQAVSDFVNSYNSIISKIQDLTKYDEETKNVGIFQNESNISSIPRDLSHDLFNSFTIDTITKQDRNGQPYNTNITLNATDFGFAMNRTGFLDFDSAKFSEMLNKKPDKVEDFLSDENGAFTKILDYIDSLTDGSNSTLELLNQQYTNEEKSYQDTIEKTQSRIDARYDIMASQFAAYDTMINSYNIQSQTITQAIEAMIASKK
jgi:flagellar hook-associated protein 2